MFECPPTTRPPEIWSEKYVGLLDWYATLVFAIRNRDTFGWFGKTYVLLAPCNGHIREALDLCCTANPCSTNLSKQTGNCSTSTIKGNLKLPSDHTDVTWALSTQEKVKWVEQDVEEHGCDILRSTGPDIRLIKPSKHIWNLNKVSGLTGNEQNQINVAAGWLAVRNRKLQFQMSVCIPAILTEVFNGFPQFLYKNARIEPEIAQTASFQLNYSLTIRILNAIDI
jgi:hypothetical protein